MKIKNVVIVVALLIMVSMQIKAQTIKGERRIYYLDATYSMVSPNRLWKPCKENLIRAIQNIDDCNTEIVVVVFADDRNPAKNVWYKWEDKATDSGKQRLIDNIKAVPHPVKSTMTNLYRPWTDFYNEVKRDKVNYMFLMTDGEHEQGGDFLGAIDMWCSSTGLLTYGFFVELNTKLNTASSKAVHKHIDAQKERLWRVSTADVNINLIRLENLSTFNVRNDEFIDIPVYLTGKKISVLKNLKFTLKGCNDFNINKVDVSSDNVRLYVSNNADIFNFPVRSNFTVNVELQDPDDKTFLLTNSVKVNCLNEKERAVKLEKTKICGKVKHYDSFAFVKAKTTPFESDIEMKWSNDAICDKSTYAELFIADNNGKKMSYSDIEFDIDGKSVDRFRIEPGSNKMTIWISFPEEAEYGTYQGCVKVGKHEMERVNNFVLDGAVNPDILSWNIKYVHVMNPLEKLLLWIAISIFTILTIWFVFIRPVVYPRFHKFKKNVLIRSNDAIVAQFSVNFKGAVRVVFTDKKVHQSSICRLFTGKIVSVINPYFEVPLTFVPKKKRSAMVIGKGYFVTPNPVPQSGVATISNAQKKLTVTLQ
ncbi:MAG: hypothetical protein NC115_05330 [Bacteroidales bacterium]|nr:hypothetical protein [Bacteroidales bacterium]